MKKYTALLLACILILCLCSCKGKVKDPEPPELYENQLIGDNLPQPIYLTTYGVDFDVVIDPCEGNWVVSDVNEEFFDYFPAVYDGSAATIKFSTLAEFTTETITFANAEAGKKVSLTLKNREKGMVIDKVQVSDYAVPQDHSNLDRLSEAYGIEIAIPSDAILGDIWTKLNDENRDKLDTANIYFEYEGIEFMLEIDTTQSYDQWLEWLAGINKDYAPSVTSKNVAERRATHSDYNGNTYLYWDNGENGVCSLTVNGGTSESEITKVAEIILNKK